MIHRKGKRQKDYWVKVKSEQVIRGYFYINGKRIQKKIASFDEAGLDVNGELALKSQAALKRFDSLIIKRWAKKEHELKTQQPAKNLEKGSIKHFLQKWMDLAAIDRAPRTIQLIGTWF